MDDPESWRWIWLAAVVVFGIGEMASPGAFFLAPFAVGALAATALAFAGAPLALQWGVFVGVSLVALFALRPLAKRLAAADDDAGIGSRRLVGRSGMVLADITPTELGVVRIDREEWRAESVDRTHIPVGATIRVTQVEGTRVIVSLNKEHAS
jgi:membrane protein implicated in regulation of membrane protease activity